LNRGFEIHLKKVRLKEIYKEFLKEYFYKYLKKGYSNVK